MESFLQTLLDRGFSDPNAVAAYRAFSSFLLGHLLLEVSGLGVDIGPVDEPDPDQAAGQDLSEYPHLLRLQSELSQDHSATEFEQSLDNLLDRLALRDPLINRTGQAVSSLTRPGWPCSMWSPGPRSVLGWSLRAWGTTSTQRPVWGAARAPRRPRPPCGAKH